ncbi:hypothetical protein BWK69_01330, partial [Candidatus Parcubacteria bacterium A4]
MTENFIIKGGIPLSGTVEISGYKNAGGAVLAAALLTDGNSLIDNLPLTSDILNQIKMLEKMGAKVEWLEKNKIKINTKNVNPEKISPELFGKSRVSVLMLGPLLAKFKKIKTPRPGGDKIGIRPIDTHLLAFKDFGVKIKEENGFYLLEAPIKLKGKKIILKEFSVTATENLMMLAVLAQGKTIIEIAAAEPQVQNLGKMLISMGANIKGAGSHTIEIEGVKKMSGAKHSICPDPLETGAFMIAIAMTGGEGIIKNTCPEHLTFFLEKMKEVGINFKTIAKQQKFGTGEILIRHSGNFKAAKIQALPYPGFPTDLQPHTSVLLTQAKGKSLVHEPLYENRFLYMQELRKMGADIELTDPHRALIFGKKE